MEHCAVSPLSWWHGAGVARRQKLHEPHEHESAHEAFEHAASHLLHVLSDGVDCAVLNMLPKASSEFSSDDAGGPPWPGWPARARPTPSARIPATTRPREEEPRPAIVFCPRTRRAPMYSESKYSCKSSLSRTYLPRYARLCLFLETPARAPPGPAHPRTEGRCLN